MGLEIDPLAKGLDDGHQTGDELFVSCDLEVMEEGLDEGDSLFPSESKQQLTIRKKYRQPSLSICHLLSL
jgi:hypothetical protein